MLATTKRTTSRSENQLSLQFGQPGRPIKHPGLYSWISMKIQESPGLSSKDVYNIRPGQYDTVPRRIFDAYYKRAKQQESSWMHGRQKQRVRAESRTFCAQYLDVHDDAEKLIISLPYDRIWQTCAYFKQFRHIGQSNTRFLFFENNANRAHDVINAAARSDEKNFTIIFDDIFTAGQMLIPDKTAQAIDLDLMGTASASLLKKVRKFVLSKADPNGCFIFFNTSFGRSITLKETEAAHKALVAALLAHFITSGVRVRSISRKYRDSYPMYATSIVIGG